MDSFSFGGIKSEPPSDTSMFTFGLPPYNNAPSMGAGHQFHPSAAFNLTQQSFYPGGTSGVMSEDTMRKLSALQGKLNQRLGPEFVSQRAGHGGAKVAYMEGWKAINLANEVFGFNGWSSSIVCLTTDFIDYDENRKSYNVGVSAIMRVTLRDGTYHEDVGYGILENSRQKGAALDKCKKEAVTDGLKRALRNLGNLMGNCLYDKSFSSEVLKMKVPPARFDPTDLHRRAEFDASLNPSTLTASAAHQQKQQSGTTARVSPPVAGPSNVQGPGMQQKPQMKQQQALNNPPAPRVSFAPQPAKSEPLPAPVPLVAPTGVSDKGKARLLSEDSYDFGDDDELYASVDLDALGVEQSADLGRPIDMEADMGRPIDFDEGLLGAQQRKAEQKKQASRPPPQITSSDRQGSLSMREKIAAALAKTGPGSLSSSDSENGPSSMSEGVQETSIDTSRVLSDSITMPPPPAPGAQSTSGQQPQQRMTTNTSSMAQQRHQRYTSLRQDQNLNPDSTGISALAHSETVNYQARRDSQPSMNAASASGVGGFNFPPGVGIKRPADSMSNGHVGGQGMRGMGHGMGLQQASSMNGPSRREVLGALDVPPGYGDPKRMRR